MHTHTHTHHTTHHKHKHTHAHTHAHAHSSVRTHTHLNMLRNCFDNVYTYVLIIISSQWFNDITCSFNIHICSTVLTLLFSVCLSAFCSFTYVPIYVCCVCFCLFSCSKNSDLEAELVQITSKMEVLLYERDTPYMNSAVDLEVSERLKEAMEAGTLGKVEGMTASARAEKP